MKDIKKIGLASDHRGFVLKTRLISYLKSKGYEVLDFGTYSKDSCDYPDYVVPAVKSVVSNEIQCAIVICYTGIGSCIVANKIKGIRAGLVYNIKSARLSRQHNDANVLVLPAGFMSMKLAKRVVDVWLNTEFEGGRHLRRVRKIIKVEEENV